YWKKKTSKKIIIYFNKKKKKKEEMDKHFFFFFYIINRIVPLFFSDQLLVIVDSLISTNGYFDTLDFAEKLKKWQKMGHPELDNKPPLGIGMTVGSVLDHKNFLKSPHESALYVWKKIGNKDLAANGGLM